MGKQKSHYLYLPIKIGRVIYPRDDKWMRPVQTQNYRNYVRSGSEFGPN